MHETETPLSLAQWWTLLDPYVITVCIDRKIGLLRSGKAVKVVKGVAVVSNTFVRTKRKYTKKNQIVGRFRDQEGSSDESWRPVPESGITSNQMDTSLSIIQSGAGHTECNTSASVRKRKMALLGDASAMMLSNLSPSPSEDFHMNVSVARESAVLYLEPSKSQDLKLDEGVLIDQTVGCTTVGEQIPLNLKVEIDGMNAQEAKQRRDMMRSEHNQQREQSACEDHQAEKVCNRMITLYKDDALAEDDIQAIQGVASVQEMQKKTRRKYGHTRKKFKSLLEVEGIKSISKHKKAGLAASPSVESHSSNLLYLDAEQEDFATATFHPSCLFTQGCLFAENCCWNVNSIRGAEDAIYCVGGAKQSHSTLCAWRT
ncbi:hypothetical protein MRB53_035884 [Persea americana]|uniref:Uncharacterized protein n=1 Tax=Persea americana TaxID=3435 RepID=A0ACC2K5X6_PERAE|nr:hypothetical protein MRB53_035884 [Persea americana]